MPKQHPSLNTCITVAWQHNAKMRPAYYHPGNTTQTALLIWSGHPCYHQDTKSQPKTKPDRTEGEGSLRISWLQSVEPRRGIPPEKKDILELLELTDTSPLADTWLVEGGRPCPSGAYPMVTCRRVAVFRKRNERVLQLSWPAAENCFSLPLSPPKSLEFPGHWVTTKFPEICLVTETV